MFIYETEHKKPDRLDSDQIIIREQPTVLLVVAKMYVRRRRRGEICFFIVTDGNTRHSSSCLPTEISLVSEVVFMGGGICASYVVVMRTHDEHQKKTFPPYDYLPYSVSIINSTTQPDTNIKIQEMFSIVMVNEPPYELLYARCTPPFFSFEFSVVASTRTWIDLLRNTW